MELSHRLAPPETRLEKVQRGANAHPAGSAISDGGWPAIALKRFPLSPARRSIRGMEASKPWVYGINGLA